MADMTLTELFKIHEEQNEKGMGMSDMFKAMLNGAWSSVKKVPDFLSDKALSIMHYHDDNIAVPAGTKTLLGDDFGTLYEESKTAERSSSDGRKHTYIESKSSYRTEMYGLVSGHWMSYDLCSESSKAAYEITLLSKKYANMYEDGNDALNDKVAEEFGTKMAEYKNYCESHDMNWDNVLREVSGELQIESYEFKEASKQLVTNIGPIGTNFDSERILANRAHSMIKTCMDDSSKDNLAPRLTGKIEYEDTFDTTVSQDSKFLNKLAAWFKSGYEKVKNAVTSFHPIKSLKESVVKTVARIEGVDYGQNDDGISADTTEVEMF